MDEVLDSVEGFALRRRWNDEFFFESYTVRLFRLPQHAKQAATVEIKHHNRLRYWERFGAGEQLPESARPGRELTQDDFEIIPIRVDVILKGE